MEAIDWGNRTSRRQKINLEQEQTLLKRPAALIGKYWKDREKNYLL